MPTKHDCQESEGHGEHALRRSQEGEARSEHAAEGAFTADRLLFLIVSSLLNPAPFAQGMMFADDGIGAEVALIVHAALHDEKVSELRGPLEGRSPAALTIRSLAFLMS